MFSEATQKEGFSSLLNFSRWIASFFVLIFHLRNQLFPTFDYQHNYYYSMTLFDFLTNLGGPAVSIFFSISGFLIGEKVLNQISNNNFNVKQYFIDRFTRIYVVLFPAILLTLLIDGLQLYFIPQKQTLPLFDSFTVKDFFGSLFMLQSFFVKPFGTNGALWSLSYEWLFYICFPIHCQLILKRRLKPAAIILLLFSLFLFRYNFATIFYYGAWLTGVFIRNKQLNWFLTKIRIIGFPLSVLFLVLLVPLFDQQARFRFFAYSLNFSILLSYCASLNYHNKLVFLFFNTASKLHHFLAEFSFSLYSIHVPIVMLLVSNIKMVRTFTNSLVDYLILVSLVVFIYFCAYVFSKFTEQKRLLIRDKLYSFFKIKYLNQPIPSISTTSIAR